MVWHAVCMRMKVDTIVSSLHYHCASLSTKLSLALALRQQKSHMFWIVMAFPGSGHIFHGTVPCVPARACGADQDWSHGKSDAKLHEGADEGGDANPGVHLSIDLEALGEASHEVSSCKISAFSSHP